MPSDNGYEQRRAERERLRKEYGGLLDEISAILFRIDLVGINFGVNHDEYDLEAGTILPQLVDATSAEDVQRIVHDDFVRWFGERWYGRLKDERLRKRDEAAAEIWQAWQRHLADSR